jgi:hypothetical protein
MDEHTCGYEHDADQTCEQAEAMWEAYYADEAAAEYAAEMAAERYFEDRGYWEAIAHDEWEAARGVVPFHVALAEAEAAAARAA